MDWQLMGENEKGDGQIPSAPLAFIVVSNPHGVGLGVSCFSGVLAPPRISARGRGFPKPNAGHSCLLLLAAPLRVTSEINVHGDRQLPPTRRCIGSGMAWQ